MGKANFTEDFKRDAVLQVTERGYPAAEVAARLGSARARSTSGRSGTRSLPRQPAMTITLPRSAG